MIADSRLVVAGNKSIGKITEKRLNFGSEKVSIDLWWRIRLKLGLSFGGKYVLNSSGLSRKHFWFKIILFSLFFFFGDFLFGFINSAL